MYGDECGDFACGDWGFAWRIVGTRKVSFEIKLTKRSLELTEVIWSDAFPPLRIPSLWADVERFPFVWKTRKFRREFKWNGSSRLKFSGKKVIPFEVLRFSVFTETTEIFCTIFVRITSAGLHVERKRKIYRFFFLDDTTQSCSYFGSQKNTSTIWRKFFTQISVQMVSTSNLTLR